MIRIGVDYYPEHWDPSLWEKDVREMQRVGVTTVRIGEFSWGLLEPEEGKFDFDWLDKAIRLLGDSGLEIILGTPTNCPPLWMYRKYPETLQVERDGRPTATGIRGHRCMESPVFRRFAARILGEMTRRYGHNPHVIAWQIDNELGANTCACPVCTARFRRFLQNKYGTLEQLNRRWGTDVWSGEISDWDQITAPLGAQYDLGWYNPGYMLDFLRHAAASTADYTAFQIREIRKNIPGAVLTTNACFGQYTQDFYQEFGLLDVAGYDNYPEVRIPADPEALYSTGWVLDLMRGAKHKNFWILEQLSGPKGCWGPVSPTPRPGMVDGYALQDIAHGADMVLHFRWRSAARGAEMLWHGLIDQSGVPGRRFAEFERLCARAKELDWLDGTTLRCPAAILVSMEQASAFQIQRQSEGFDYWHEVRRWHDALAAFGVNTDVVHEEAPLDGYRLVILPCHYLTNPKTVENLRTFVRGGGTAVITARSGVKDPDNACVMAPLPGALAELCGCTVTEYDPVGRGAVKVERGGCTYTADTWCDLLAPTTAKTFARYAGEFYAGTPAVTKNRYGAGAVYYVGVCGHKALTRAIVRHALDAAKIAYCDTLPDGVQLTTRENAHVKAQFLFNESETEKRFSLDGRLVTLRPFEMRISRRDLDGRANPQGE